MKRRLKSLRRDTGAAGEYTPQISDKSRTIWRKLSDDAEILLEDRRMWIERVYALQQDKSV